MTNKPDFEISRASPPAYVLRLPDAFEAPPQSITHNCTLGAHSLPREAVLFRIHRDGHTISVLDVPGYHCDTCGLTATTPAVEDELYRQLDAYIVSIRFSLWGPVND